MATLVLSAAGAAIGGSLGGTVAGVSAAAAGRMAGAVIGRSIDQRVLGSGSDPVQTGHVDRFRIAQSIDGAPIPRVFGRMRLGGTVIWASDFVEHSTTSGGGGGKGSPSRPQTTTYAYTVSLAIALCEGTVSSLTRVWANGEEISTNDMSLTLYTGAEDQQPDPLIEASKGAGNAPAYRGTAYVVIENLDLQPFDNRLPQLSFEVVAAEPETSPEFSADLSQIVPGVALMPGTGEYALSPAIVHLRDDNGGRWPANRTSYSGQSDFSTSVQALQDALPKAKAVSLIASWFGNDLRCADCTIRPKVETSDADGQEMAWRVAGLSRGVAQRVPVDDNGRPVYGGTPDDASVVAAIRDLTARGLQVMFYPFTLMDQLAGNGLPDPWSDDPNQPPLAWRGRITTDIAPGRVGSADQTAAAGAQVAQFFGTAKASDFAVLDGQVVYSGPAEWGMRRFILHYAALAAAAGGVESFCIGSELRGLTQIRDHLGFPAVTQLQNLAAEVRSLLGDQVKLTYAADWSEYSGYQPADSPGDKYFHLDPLWADPEIDFIGIDNYMPLSDWRDGHDHLDAAFGSIYAPEYLQSNIAGAEMFDWYYASDLDRAAQIRTPITDGVYNEPWVWRTKDIRSWWENEHHNRIAGQRQPNATPWVPQSKPIRFTELGCAAIDKGTNQPNKFLDPKSSESAMPYFSTGARDDLIQLAYLQAMTRFWGDCANNPLSSVFAQPMVDMDHAYVWAWDARPYPAFPAYREHWSDGENYARGHWLNGRVGSRTLASVVRQICLDAGVVQIDVSRLFGVVRGYVVDRLGDARAALQPLMLRHGFDVVDIKGTLHFISRSAVMPKNIPADALARHRSLDTAVEQFRSAEADLSGRVRVRFAEGDGDHALLSEEAVLPDDTTHAITTNDLAMIMGRGEAQSVAQRWLAEARLARAGIRFALPPSLQSVSVADVVSLPTIPGHWRIDRLERAGGQLAEATRTDPGLHAPAPGAEFSPHVTSPEPVLPVSLLFMDLPLLTGNEDPISPRIAATKRIGHWPGPVAVHGSLSDDNYHLKGMVHHPTIAGTLYADLAAHAAGRWDRANVIEVQLTFGNLQSRDRLAVLNGANTAVIGDGTPDAGR
jgi:hypothetical protein